MILALLLSCVTDLGTLDALAAEYAARTAAASEPGLRASLAIGALAGQICTQILPNAWNDLSLGQPWPMPEDLAGQLGAPTLESFRDAGNVVELSLSPVTLLGQEAALRLKVSDGGGEGGAITVSATASALSDEAVLGSVDYELGGDCADIRIRVVGTATWTWEGSTHTYALPGAESESSAMVWPGAVSWLPGQGRIKWSGVIDGQERSWLSADASAIDAEALSWSATVSGGSNDRQQAWEAEVELALQP